jgi:glycosyltransferase involved in cell wall biosynthesis
MKKICHVLIVYGNKNQNYTTELLKGLNNSDSNYHFVYSHAQLRASEGINVFQSKDLSRFKSFLLLISLYIKDQEFRVLYNQVGYKKIYKWLILINLEVDVIHIHHLHAVPKEVIVYLKKKKIRLIASLRGRDLIVNTKDKLKADDVLKKLKLMSVIHSISHYMAFELKSKFEMSSEIIYRGIQMPEELNLKKSNLVTDSIKILAVGRLDWEKGHIYLIESISRLVKKGHKITLDIYGDGPLMEFLNFRIDQLGLNDHIILKNYVDNSKLKLLYKNYNLALQPSLTEALSNGLIDFMIHDLPCVISNEGGMKEIIIHGRNGFVFNIQNPTEMDDYIFEALKIDFNKLKEFNDVHKKKFYIKNEIKALEDLYTRNDR